MKFINTLLFGDINVESSDFVDSSSANSHASDGYSCVVSSTSENFM